MLCFDPTIEKFTELAALLFDIKEWEYETMNELYHIIKNKQDEYSEQFASLLKDFAIHHEGWTESISCTDYFVWKD